MVGAVINNNIVENVIILEESQIEYFSQLLQREIIDARPYGLVIGDYRLNETTWGRNADGEQIVLPLLEPKAYDSYSIAAARIVELEEQQEVIAETEVDKALAILTGETEE